MTRTIVARLLPGQDLKRELLALAQREATAEVVVAADDRLRFDREHDPATGYDELVVRPANSAHTGGADSA